MSNHTLSCANISARIFSHASKPLAGVSVVFVAMSVAEWIMQPSVAPYTAALSALHIVLIAALPLWPRRCSAYIVVLFALCAVLPDATGPSQFWGVWLALSCLAYEQNSFSSLVWPVFATLARIAQTLEAHEYLPTSLLVIMMFFVSWLIGYTLRQRKKAEAEAVERRRYEQARRQLALTRRDMALASRIHDSVTGNLAYLAISLERARQDALEDSGEVPDFAYMHEMTVETLREVRQVIDVLDGDNRQINADGQPLFSERIDSELAQGDQYLHTLGFHGESRLRVESTAEGTDTQVVDEVSALLRELVTNIALHGRTAPHEYTLDVHVSDVAVTVSQANAIAAQSSFPDKPASGKGLDFHRRIIEGWGGQLSTCAEEDTWVCHASIPRHIVTI